MQLSFRTIGAPPRLAARQRRLTATSPRQQSLYAPARSRQALRPAAAAAAGAAAASPSSASAEAAPLVGLWGNLVSDLMRPGVPLVDQLMERTLAMAVADCAGILAFTALAVLLGQKILNWCESQLAQLVEHTHTARGLELLVKTAMVAIHAPAAAILPFYGLTYSLLVLGSLMEVVALKLKIEVYGRTHILAHHLMVLLRRAVQLMQDSTEILCILFVAWFLIGWKNRFVAALTAQVTDSQDSEDEQRWSRLLVPLNSVASWIIVGMAAPLCLAALGIDMRPLLAVGSVGTLAVGFAAQSTISNFVSAMAIYALRPFIKGDRIQLRSPGGSVIVAGVVERIEPMRTVIRTDQKTPIYLPNKDVSNLLVVNESQVRLVSVQPAIPVLEVDLVLRYPQDVDKTEAIEEAIRDYLNTCAEVERGTAKCGLAEFSSKGPVIRIKAIMKLALANQATKVRAKLLRGAERIVREHGAMIAVDGPPVLQLFPQGAQAAAVAAAATPAAPAPPAAQPPASSA